MEMGLVMEIHFRLGDIYLDMFVMSKRMVNQTVSFVHQYNIGKIKLYLTCVSRNDLQDRI